MSKLRVGIIFGGRSVEHEVSVASATSVLGALDPARYEVALIGVDPGGRWHLAPPGALPEGAMVGEEVSLPAVPGERQLIRSRGGEATGRLDVVIPLVHGTGGEDGSLQGFLELADVPYVGSGVLSSAMQMDKDVAKRLLAAGGLPVVPWATVRTPELLQDPAGVARRVLAEIGLPLFVKPANLGSSVGISRVDRAGELEAALAEAARYDLKILAEQAVDAREIEVAVIGTHPPEASVPGEIVPKKEFYDYESKYVDEDTELVVPAPLPEAQTTELRRMAVLAFGLLEAEGLARVDFLVDRTSGTPWLSELNSLPGFTEASMFPRLWEATGLPYPALLDRLIELALERHQHKTRLERTYRRG
ncbi:MAG: D-alanine--D-alanine ligase family protein [Myxococcota bacterium]